jgi:hypothetical protein
MKAQRLITSDYLKTIAEAKLSPVKTRLLVTAYHEAGPINIPAF